MIRVKLKELEETPCFVETGGSVKITSKKGGNKMQDINKDKGLSEIINAYLEEKEKKAVYL